MEIDSAIREAASDPEKLEQLYQIARRSGQASAFETALLSCHEAAPDNLLYAAWFHRLRQAADEGPHVAAIRRIGRGTNWIAAVPLSVLTGLIFWALSDFEMVLAGGMPQLFLWWSPIATMSALIYLLVTSRKALGRGLALGLGLQVAAAYVTLLSPVVDPAWKASQFVTLGAIHLPMLCWVALGISVLGPRSSTEDRFAFLIKSIEVVITGGLYLIAGIAFGGITLGMFAALSIELPDIWLRLVAAGGFGLLPVLAVATTYDPSVAPAEQDFDQGLSRFVATLMRLLLPLTLGVLAVYVVVIPFNFRAPFENRDVLIVYNLMLFAIVGLLVGATPVRTDTLSPALQRWLRRGILAVAILVELVSLYALSATVYRTIQGGWTPNRLTIIGWNCINMAILALLLARQAREGSERWVESLKSVFSLATNAYLVWAAFLLVAVPLLF
jgi:hypothetical protein